MNRIELIRWSLQMTEQNTVGLVEDMREIPLTQTTPGGNHPIWILGHLATIEGQIPAVLFGETNPVAHWWPLFGMGSEVKTDAALYPSFDELLGTYRLLRAGTLKLLDQIGEAGLDRVPKNVPPGFEKEMQTFGQTLLVIAIHNMQHAGQIADTRRAAGRKPRI
ncbi:MAG: hypothetical protein JWN24_355 [Phycisphaerales bacterium]|nr:hypothetical protein [Phycisphaerales bacterium]